VSVASTGIGVWQYVGHHEALWLVITLALTVLWLLQDNFRLRLLASKDRVERKRIANLVVKDTERPIAGVHIPGTFTTRETAPDRDIIKRHVMEEEHKGSASSEATLGAKANGGMELPSEERSDDE